MTATLTMNEYALDSHFESLFDDFSIPDHLLKYKEADIVDAAVVKELGERAFLRLLHYELKGRSLPMRKSAVPLACEDVESVVEYKPGKTVMTTFHPSTPYPEDYALGEQDYDYRRDQHTADVQQYLAQKMCSSCPIADICLDLSIIHSSPDGVWGVWGGQHERTRKLILNRYNKLRRAYNSTKTQDMSKEERAKYEMLATNFYSQED